MVENRSQENETVVITKDEPVDIRQKETTGASIPNLRPMLFLLGVSGCYTFQQKWRIVDVINWIYKVIIVVTCVYWTSRFFIQMDNFPSSISSITITMFSLQCIGNWLICWKSFNPKFGNFKKSFDLLKDILDGLHKSYIRLDYAYISKRQNICIFSAAFLLLSDILIQVLNAYVFQENLGEMIDGKFNLSADDTGDFNQSLGYFTYPFEDTAFTRFLVLIPVFFLAAALIIPPFYLTVINIVLTAMFKALNDRFNQLFASKRVLESIERFRQDHMKLTSLITELDHDYQFLYGNIFFWTLCQGILTLYILVKFEQHYIIILGLLHLMLLSVTVLLIMAISAALLHEAAHAPLNIIYNINVEAISLEKATQLNLFLSKLTGTKIGFTTFGLLTITKEFILTIAGVFLTYFAVIYTL